MLVIGLLKFGLQGDTTDGYKDAYKIAFQLERNRAAWAAVVAAHL